MQPLTNSISGIVATPQLFERQPLVKLEHIRQANGDINAVRMLFKGDEKACLELFSEAVKEGDVITQIQLSHVLFYMRSRKDSDRDFYRLEATDLEESRYHPSEFEHYNQAYDEAVEKEPQLKLRYTRAYEVFRQAAGLGFLPAVLEFLCEKRKWETETYGFAVELRRYVGQGDKTLDYYFGQALKSGCRVGTDLYYEGIYWMHRSLGFSVFYPAQDQTFDELKHRFTLSERFSSSYHDHDGLRVGRNWFLAPTKEVWETFVKEKLDTVTISPIDTYMFNSKEIEGLLEKYNVTLHHKKSHEKETIELRENIEIVGAISIRLEDCQLVRTFTHPKLQPIIDYVENILSRTGSVGTLRLLPWFREHRDKVDFLVTPEDVEEWGYTEIVHELCEMDVEGKRRPCSFDRLKEIIARLAESDRLFLLNTIPKFYRDSQASVPMTPLSYWIYSNNRDAVNLLLQYGAAVRIEDNRDPEHKGWMFKHIHFPNHRSALLQATRHRLPEIVECLLEHGANGSFAFDDNLLFSFIPALIFDAIQGRNLFGFDIQKEFVTCLELIFNAMPHQELQKQLQVPISVEPTPLNVITWMREQNESEGRNLLLELLEKYADNADQVYTMEQLRKIGEIGHTLDERVRLKLTT
jgi:hypothetical protein